MQVLGLVGRTAGPLLLSERPFHSTAPALGISKALETPSATQLSWFKKRKDS